MITAERYFGDARFLSLTANTAIFPQAWRVYAVSATSAGFALVLPAVGSSFEIMPGGPVAYLLNVGANSFLVHKSDASTIATVLAGQFVKLWLRDRDTAPGSWSVRLGTIKT